MVLPNQKEPVDIGASGEEPHSGDWLVVTEGGEATVSDSPETAPGESSRIVKVTVGRPSDNAVLESRLVAILRNFDEGSFVAGPSETGTTSYTHGWMEFENFWVYTKLQANKTLRVTSNRGGAGPRQDDLQGPRYIRATFEDGSKAITTDVFLEEANMKSPRESSRSSEIPIGRAK